MIFDPNCKNISPLFLAAVHDGKISYRRISMEKAYARVGEDGVQYAGPALPNQPGDGLPIGVFGPKADQFVRSPEAAQLLEKLNTGGRYFSLVGVASDGSWGKASTDLIHAVYDQHVLGVIALDRPSSHLAEQIGVKAFVPVIAISSDHALTSTNIPWIFRLPEGATVEKALLCFADAVNSAGPNRGKIRELLASGTLVAGVRFQSTGELQ